MIAVIGLIVGALAGILLEPTVPTFLQPYLPIAVVAALETQYDSVVPGRANIGSADDIPSADEIGARLEAFLEANDTQDFGRGEL